jgi:hypothetical protein
MGSPLAHRRHLTPASDKDGSRGEDRGMSAEREVLGEGAVGTGEHVIEAAESKWQEE